MKVLCGKICSLFGDIRSKHPATRFMSTFQQKTARNRAPKFMAKQYKNSNGYSRVNNYDIFDLHGGEKAINTMEEIFEHHKKQRSPTNPHKVMKKLIQMQTNQGRVSEALITTFLKQCEETNLARSLRYFRVLQRKCITFNTVHYNFLINAFGKRGMTTGMLQFFDEMKLVGLYPNAVTYNILMKSFGQTGNTDTMLKYWNDMKQDLSEDISTRDYAVIIDALGKHGPIQLMKDMFSEMARKEIPYDIFVFNSVMYALVKHNLSHEIPHYVELMTKYSVEPNAATFNILMNCYILQQNWNATLQCLIRMNRTGQKPHFTALTKLISLCDEFISNDNPELTLRQLLYVYETLRHEKIELSDSHYEQFLEAFDKRGLKERLKQFSPSLYYFRSTE